LRQLAMKDLLYNITDVSMNRLECVCWENRFKWTI